MPEFNDLPPNVQQQIQRAYIHIKAPASARRLWERLTEAERQQLGGDLRAAYSRAEETPGLWVELHSVSPLRAILDVAWRLNFLGDHDYEWLVREIGEDPTPPPSNKPVWNRDRGELHFEGKRVRTVKRVAVAKNIVAILDAFQAQNWPDRIDDPLPGRADPQRLREAVASLNDRLEKDGHIRFRSDGESRGVVWDAV